MKAIKTIFIICYILMLVLLSIATFWKQFYHAWWMTALWGLLTVGSAVFVFEQKLYRKNIAIFLLHFAFIIILSGAFVTHISARDGSITLYKDLPAVTNGFPFSLQLQNFEVQTYKGTNAPSDYISTVLVIDKDTATKTISMNNILSHRGYRFYQASFNADRNSSTLLYSYDPYGVAITYTGYFLFFISTVLLLIRNFSSRKNIVAIAAICVLPSFTHIQAQDQLTNDSLTLDKTSAAQWALTPVVYNGRITPLQTVAVDFTKKLTGKSSYRYANAAQVLAGWKLFPQKWVDVPMFQIKDRRLRQIILDTTHPHKYATLNDLFNDQGGYKLELFYDELYSYHSQGKRSAFAKEASALNEKVQVLIMLQNDELYIPANPQHVSQPRLILEYYYQRVALFDRLFILVLSMGVICLILNFIRRKTALNTLRLNKVFLWFSLAATLFGYIARWIIGNHIPLSNGHETMLFLALVLLVITLIAGRKNALFSSLGLFLSGLILLTANIANKDPQITSLIPVLNSPWLALHVSLMMISYALFALMFTVALTYFALLPFKKASAVSSLNMLCGKLHLSATLLMGCGIFVGAIWANVSWGRYWGWDPKEVWALITFMLAAMPLHIRFKSLSAAHGFTLLIGLSILMTYFGVNAFLGGLHSY
jgi:ABC-type transport system involved in cytochrome c biogenesis permease subunit